MTPREILVRRVTAVVFLVINLPLVLVNAWFAGWESVESRPLYFLIPLHVFAATILTYVVIREVESLCRLHRISRLQKKLATLEARLRQIDTIARYRAITNMYRGRN